MSENQQKNFKEIIKQEIARCKADPVYFIRKYVYIQHPQRGRILFNLFPFQEKVLRLLFDYNYNDIILKSRQLGISTLVGPGLGLWTMLFQESKTILVLATKQETAKNLVTKVIFAYDNLPSWLKLDYKEKNKLSLKLINGSQIVATSAASDSARSHASSILIIDEAAFIDNIEETYASAQQTLATGGKSIILSTPNGTANWFCEKFEEAEEKYPDSNFRPIRLPWTVHPERNQAWRDKQNADLGIKMAAQECDCDFVTSGETVYESEVLEFYKKTHVVSPHEKSGFDGNYWIWSYPEYNANRQYMVVADVARGDGKDFSTFQVIDVETAEQVAEYKGQLGTTDFGNLLVAIATQWGDAILIIENTGVGWAVIQQVINRGYRNLFYSAKSDMKVIDVNTYLNKYDENNANMVPGFTNSLKTRPLLISKLGEYLNENSCIIHSSRLLNELTKFVWRNGRAGAGDGAHDDLIFPFAIGMFVRDTILKYRQQGIDLTKAALGGITKNSGIGQGIYNQNSFNFKNYNPWKMNLGPNGDEEDLSSWIR